MSKIYFSSVWEDYQSLKEGLHPSEGDVVVTVSSSGDNVFNFLADNVASIVAVDVNPAQLSLAKLKLEIIRRCEQEKAVELLTGTGNTEDTNAWIRNLVLSDKTLKEHLGRYDFGHGVDAVGQFETNVLPILSFFARRVLKETDFRYAGARNKRPSAWLNILVTLFSIKWTYKFLLPDFPYEYININIRESLNKSLINFFAQNDFSKNWYLQKIYFGRYHTLPPFLRDENFSAIRNNLDAVTFVENNILDYLKELEDRTVHKINLSDIFDWCSAEEYSKILQESYRVLVPGGLLFYWELFVSREVPESLGGMFEVLREEADAIQKNDNLPFYHRIVLLRKRST